MSLDVIEGGSEPLICSDALRVGIFELVQVVCDLLIEASSDEWVVEENRDCLWVANVNKTDESSKIFACRLGLLTESSSLNCCLHTSDQYVVEQVYQVLDRFSWWQGVSVEIYWDKT